MNPILRLHDCAAKLRAGVVDNENATWLESAAQAHCRGESLERALGLVGATGRSALFELRWAQRNQILTEALEEVGGSVKQLAAEIVAYVERVPHSQRNRQAPDPMWTPARALIHRAHRLNIDVPATERGLRRVLRGQEGGLLLSAGSAEHSMATNDEWSGP